jgi:hypothetical protein
MIPPCATARDGVVSRNGKYIFSQESQSRVGPPTRLQPAPLEDDEGFGEGNGKRCKCRKSLQRFSGHRQSTEARHHQEEHSRPHEIAALQESEIISRFGLPNTKPRSGFLCLSELVTDIFSPSLENSATPPRGRAYSRDIAPASTSRKNLPQGRSFRLGAPGRNRTYITSSARMRPIR